MRTRCRATTPGCSVTGREVSIEDLGSKNGTWVDGERIHGPCRWDGTTFRLGSETVRFELASEPPTKTAAPLLEGWPGVLPTDRCLLEGEPTVFFGEERTKISKFCPLHGSGFCCSFDVR